MKLISHLIYRILVTCMLFLCIAAAHSAEVTIRWVGTIQNTDIRFEGQFSFLTDDPSATSIIDLLTVGTNTDVVVSDGITSQTWSYIVPAPPFDSLPFRYCPGGESQCGIPAPGAFVASLLPAWTGTPLQTDCGSFTPVPCLVNLVRFTGEDPPIATVFTDVSLATANFTFEIIPNPPDAVIPITATETFFDFDLSGLSPTPPYDSIVFSAEFDATNPIDVGVDSMLTNLYGDLGGVNLVQSRNDTLPGFPFDVSFNEDGTLYGPLATANPIFDPMLDGIFSFGLKMLEGSTNLVSFTACGQIFATGTLTCITHPISDENIAPTAEAGPDQAVRVGDTVFLDGSASFDDNTPTASLAYSWSFSSLPAGSSAVLQGANPVSPTFFVDVDGTYAVQLVVTDGSGLASMSDEVIISSDNLAPTADAGLDQLVVVNSAVFLDGSRSIDPELDPLTYSWAISDTPIGSIASLVGDDTASPNFVPDLAGAYEITLTVSDFIGPGAPGSVSITAVSSDQFAVISIVSADQTIVALEPAQVTTEGNQNALANFLSQATVAIQSGDIAEAINKLQKALTRTDGCVLRDDVDTNGPGRDWITDCAVQVVLYESLNQALTAITP